MSNVALRIMIIDDNINIHQDVIKVLTVSDKDSTQFSNLDTAIFGETPSVAHDNYLPQFIFETASQGEEGVNKIKQSTKEGKPYALAFVDIRMPPGWDGIKTIQQIWKIDPKIQIIICTAFSDYNWEQTIKKLGISDNFLILKKPFDNMAVRQLACALTRKWLLTQDSEKHTESLNLTVKEKTQSLQHTLSLLRATLESTTEGVLVVDLNGTVIDYNQRFVNLFNLPKSLLIHHDEALIQEFITNTIDNPALWIEQLALLHSQAEKQTKQNILLKNGKTLECSTQAYLLNKMTVGRVWSFRDVTERISMEQKLEHQATHDALTHLPNRLLLLDRIKHAIVNAVRNKTRFALLFFDLDRFKLINDSLGHEFGDLLLGAIAKKLTALMRKSDTVARLGGDEFVMLIPELSKNEDIIPLAHNIIMAFRQPFEINKQDILMNTSIGISMYPSNGKTVSTLLKNADLAMYKAKEQGGNQFKFYSNILNKQSSKKLTTEIDLRHALARNEFFLVYQPQLEIMNQEFVAVEALIRWNHPQKGLIFPLDFIPEAEESGLILPIGEWVINAACQQINAWRQAGLPYIHVAVNIAGQQLKQPDFDIQIKNIIEKYAIPPEYLELEITENVIISHAGVMLMINKLRKLGFKIILDDFGTNYSSLSHLTQINIDRLKIDRSFVKNISKSRSNEVIIEAVIAMAKNMNFKVLAEGVEAQNQIDFLKDKKCDEVQGFFYSKPLDPNAIVDFINANKLYVAKQKKETK